MQYCAKCRRVCEDAAGKCPHCKSGKLRPAGAGEQVFLCAANLYAAGQIQEAIAGAGIDCKAENASKGHSYYTFDSQAMPDGQNLYVPFGRLDEAREIAARVERELEEKEQDSQEVDPPSAKRIAAEVISIVAFLVLIMLAVYGADGLANWLKSILGMG